MSILVALTAGRCGEDCKVLFHLRCVYVLQVIDCWEINDPAGTAEAMVSMDFVKDLPVSKGYPVMLVVVDWFAKGVWFLPFGSLPNALEVTETLFQAVFLHNGILEGILSDQGPQIILRVWNALSKKLGATVSLTSGYHPESNGQAEQSVQELGRFLWAYCHGQQHDWAELLGWAEYA